MTSERDPLEKFRDAYLDYSEGLREAPPRSKTCRMNNAQQQRPL